jgi:hypothetical protein
MTKNETPRGPVGDPQGFGGQAEKGNSHSNNSPELASRRTPSPEIKDRPGVEDIYRALMVEIERLRLSRGIPLATFSEFAGLPDRYQAKALWADRPSGRQASWPMLQAMIDVLAPDGFLVRVTPKRGLRMSALRQQYALRFDRALSDQKTRRELLSEWGRRGGAARWKNSTAKDRSRFARKGGRARAKKLSAEERTKLALHASRIRSARAAARRKKSASDGPNSP